MTASLPPELWRKPNWSIDLEHPAEPPRSHLLVVVGLLIAWNVFANVVVPDGWTGAFAIVGMGVLIAVARSGGVSWDYLGLDSSSLRQGINVGLGGAGLVAVGVVAAAALPFSREFLADDRFVGVGTGEMLYESLVRIPLGTAMTEEVAFRGVLLGLLLLWFSPLKATLVAAGVFGLWHVLPGLDALETNPAGDIGDGWLLTAAGVAAQVAITAAAGVGFSWLRFRGRSLAAPFLVHWAVNATAYVAGWLVVRNAWA